MYCAHCGQPMFHKDLNNQGWCSRCGDIVEISKCKVPFWSLMAVFTIYWTLQF
jgi:hypothetical protein